MTVLSVPQEGINLSGNIADIKITAAQPVSVRLICDGEILLDESYTPDANNRISFNINEVVNSVLEFTLPPNDIYLQAGIVKSFALELDGVLHNFKAIRAGIKTLSITVEQWLTANFLTWQPQEKEVLQKQPEWLGYYATQNCKIMVRAYFKDGTHTEKVLAGLTAGNAYSINVCYGRISDLFGNLPVYYDVWVQNDLHGLSYTQRYIVRRNPAGHKYFAFENSIGGLDVACFTGENIHKPEYEPKSVTSDNLITDYNTDKSDIYSQASGWLSKDERNWLHDFFTSAARYVAADGALLPVSLTEAAPEESNKDDLCAFEFTYRMANKTPYLNIVRNYAALPEDVTITDPANIPFNLAPRLVDFPEMLLTDVAILPLQSPFEEKWYRASLGAVKNNILSAMAVSGVGEVAHTHSNLPVLNSFSIASGYLFTGSDKIKAGYADKSDLSAYAYFAEHADTAKYALSAGQSENARLWDSHEWNDWMDQPVRTIDAVIHKSLSSADFVSGFSGYGWRLDEDARLTVDYLTVRKQMDVYALAVNKIRATNGSIWVSDGAKIHSVENETTLYKCYIDTDNNKNPVPFREGDIIRCQVWSGNNIKYYCARVGSVGNNYFTLIKSTFDGSGIPASGDEVVRIGNSADTNRQGAIYLTASDNNAPYIDVIDTVTGASLSGKTKVRMGKLSGITDAAFGGALSGYGLYAQNAYISGKIHVTGGNAATNTDIDNVKNDAATDALNKANTAQSNAISAAATDASTKANNALSSAKNYTDALKNGLGAMAWDNAVELAKLGSTIIEGGRIKTSLIDANAIKISGGLASITEVSSAINNLEIGGRNYILNSDIYIERGSSTATNISKLFAVQSFSLLKGKTVTVSVDIEIQNSGGGRIGFEIAIDFIDSTRQYLNCWLVTSQGLTTKQRISNTLTVKNVEILKIAAVGIYIQCQGDVCIIGHPKLEIGNKPTDWTPAPEDVEVDATTKANNALSSAKTYTDALKNGLGAMAWETKVSFAKLDSTIIEGGYIKSSLIEVNAIKISGGLATTTDVSKAKSEAVNTAATDAQAKANTAQTNAISAAATDATTKANNALSSAKTYTDGLKNSLGAMAWDNAVELAKLGSTIIEGGRIKTSLIDANAIKISGGLASTTEVNNAIKDIQVGGTNLATGTQNIAPFTVNNGAPGRILQNTGLYVNLIAGEWYMVSFDAKLKSGSGNLHVEFWGSQGGNIIVNSGEWKRYGIKTRLVEQKALYFWLGDGTGTGGIEIRKLKIEIGNKPTDWTAAPEDVEVDAQAKANAAQNNAISAAATDATTKANNALSSSKTYTDALKNSLGALAWDSKVELAKLGTTIIQGGYINTELINVAWLKANVINSDYISAMAVDFKQGKIGGFTISASSIASSNGKIQLNNDGSGQLAGGNVSWDINGLVTLKAGQSLLKVPFVDLGVLTSNKQIDLDQYFNIKAVAYLGYNSKLILPVDTKFNGVQCLIFNAGLSMNHTFINVVQSNNSYFTGGLVQQIEIPSGKVGHFVAVLQYDNSIAWMCLNYNSL